MAAAATPALAGVATAADTSSGNAVFVCGTPIMRQILPGMPQPKEKKENHP